MCIMFYGHFDHSGNYMWLFGKILKFLLAFIASLLKFTDEDSLSKIGLYDPHTVFECSHYFKGSNFYDFIQNP